MTNSRFISAWARLSDVLKRHPFRWAAAVLAALLILTAAAVFFLLYSGPGRAALVRYLEYALSRPGETRIEIGRLEGDLPARIRIDRIAVGDGGGVWMTIRDFELDWSPLALFDARLRVDSAQAGDVAILRRPAPSAGERAGAALPVFAISLESLAVDSLRLEEPVLGQAATLRLVAGATSLRDRATAYLKFDRIDGKPGHASVDLAWNVSAGLLDIEAGLREPEDGLLARLLDLPGRPPLDLSVTGEGPAGDWRGRATLQAGSLLSLETSLLIAVDRGFRLAVQGAAVPGEALGPDALSLLGPRTVFDMELRHEAGRDDWAVTVTELTNAAIAATGTANISPDTGKVDGTAMIETVDGVRLAGLIEPANFASATAKIGFSGPLTHPVVQLETIIDRFGAEGFTAARTDLRVELHPEGPLNAADMGILIEASARFDGFETPSPELSRLFGNTPRIVMTGARLDRLTRVNFGKAELSSAMATVTWGGELALDSGVLDASGEIAVRDLAPLSGVVGRAVAGRLQSDFVLAGKSDGAIDLLLNGVLRDVSLEQPVMERLLGPKAGFAGKVRRDPDGTVLFSDLRLSGGGAVAKGRLLLRSAADRLEADYDIAVSDLEAVGIADPDRPGGTLGVTGKAAGPAGNPKIDGRLLLTGGAPGGFSVTRLEAQFTVTDVATAPRGEVRLGGETDLAPDLLGQAGFALADGRLTLSRLNLSGRGTSVEGNLAIPMDGKAVTGILSLRAPDLGPWSVLAGRKLSGALEGRVGLSGVETRQDADLDVTITNAAVDGRVSSRRIRVDMAVTDLAGLPGLKGSVRAGDLLGGPARVGELTLNLDGPLRNLKYGIQLSGSLRDRELRLTANGELVAAGERISVSVADLAGKLAGVPIRLRKPALVAARPVIDSGDIDLAVGGGVILGRFRQGDDIVSARVEVDAIPLISVWPDAPPLLDQAVVDAAASLDGPVARPGGRLDLSVTRLATDETAESPEGVSLRLQGDLRNGRLVASGRVEGLAGVTSRAQLGLPVHLSLAPVAISIDGQAPLDGSVTYNGPIAPGWALLGLDRHRLEGRGDIALEFSGRYDDPRISGQVGISDGRYENLDTGTILSEILVSARPSNSSLIIDKAVARDGGEGEVSVSGGVDFGGRDLVDMDLRASLRKARLVRRDELNAVVSGQLALRGNAARREISGKLEVEEAEIMLAGGLPASVVNIQVEEIGTPSAGGAKALMPVRPSRTDLDLAIAMPKRVFVRGRGLDSEWGGALTVTGTASSPRIQGQLTPLRGRYDFAGKIFNLREGSIAFAGKDEIDPMLDLSAEREATDLTAIIHVTGTARKPVVTLESTPQYPRDEVLARVLFNKSTGRLSAAEALQLAQAVGTLTGVSDGGGIMDFARGMLNLDVLRFGEGGAEGPGGAEAGKYISDRVYIGIEGNAAGESGVTVEIEITPRLKLESDVGAESKSQMGLKWKRDY